MSGDSRTEQVMLLGVPGGYLLGFCTGVGPEGTYLVRSPASVQFPYAFVQAGLVGSAPAVLTQPTATLLPARALSVRAAAAWCAETLPAADPLVVGYVEMVTRAARAQRPSAPALVG